jgi:hypothetical protein
MKKNVIQENIKKLKNISSKLPKTINEAINFNEDDDMDMMDDEPMEYEPMGDEPMEEPQADNGMDVMAFVDDIRKKSLKGMAQLADNPDDERYQLLKKIWQICDKKPEQQTAFGSHQPNQPQKPM